MRFVLFIMGWVINKNLFWNALSQKTFYFSVLSPTLQRIPSGWIYVQLFPIVQKSLLPKLSKHFLQSLLHFAVSEYCKSPDEWNVIFFNLFFACSVLHSLFNISHTIWASHAFLKVFLLKKKKKDDKTRQNSREKKPCKVFVFKRKIILDTKLKHFTT